MDRNDVLWYVREQQPRNVAWPQPHSPEQCVREATAESARLAIVVGATARPTRLQQEVIMAYQNQARQRGRFCLPLIVSSCS